MAIREIVTLPEPVLRRKAHQVTDFGPELQTMIDDMVETMRVAPGVGLAANQVNIPFRLIVVEYAETDEADSDESSTQEVVKIKPRLYTIANPEIIRASQDTEIGVEGCLSVPGFVGEVDRALEITVKGFNRRGQPMRIKSEGWLARIFQHEIDHLDGVLFIDRAIRVWEPEPGEEVPLD
jgi:peptide deformylase